MSLGEMRDDIAKVRDLRILILRIMWASGNPVTAQEISEKTGLKTRSASMHLSLLRKAGLIAISGEGYVITTDGEGMIRFPKIDEEMTEKILSKRPPEKAFYFYTEVDHPSGMFSDSLTDFCERIRSIDITSVEFHVGRGDFESWMHYIGDVELEERLRMIRAANLRGEELRESLYKIVVSRCDELLGIEKHSHED